MKCNICGSNEAEIRPTELSTARHSLRAHVDCSGHSEYRAVSRADVEEAQRLTKGGDDD
jgi:protein-arginine kinase activator protein McsA